MEDEAFAKGSNITQYYSRVVVLNRILNIFSEKGRTKRKYTIILKGRS